MLIELDRKTNTLVLACISFFSVLISILIGHNILLQGIWMGVAVYLLTGQRPSIVYACVISFPRDVRAAKQFLKINFFLKLWEKQNKTVAKLFQDNVRRNPNKPAIIMDGVRFTFQDIEDLSNQVAAYFKSIDYKHGDTIALVMENRPEFPCLWVGLSKLGIITALVNTNLRKQTLIHSIKVSNAKAVIVSSELADAVEEIKDDEYIKKLQIYQYHDEKSATSGLKFHQESINLYEKLKGQSKTPPLEDMEKLNMKDKLIYIYTSGTTGMPKAAVISNLRYTFMTIAGNKMFQLGDDEIIYNALPLYHTAGGILGMGNTLLFGITMALRKKFSASNFWTDCIKFNCTTAQYIGEICRYLLAAPPKPEDKQHNIKLMFGNGLRPQIWNEFINRFNIKQIGEVYGSTEGNSNLVNIDNTVGAVGFVPRFARKLYPVTLVKCDEETGDPIRNEQGLCEECKPGEMGVLLGKINRKRAVISFEGYADKKASEKKILHDVFREGDAYFNTGDILVMDLLGYFYFKDRTGDTFRWRGENVATSEVEALISNIVGLHDCVVYGVPIPHVEGKAGMAAIVDTEGKTDMQQLSAGIRGSLPAYARPIFIRLLKEVPLTGTFKLKKRDVQMDGYDINKIKDPLYFLNSDGVYRPFTEKDFNDVMNGRARL